MRFTHWIVPLSLVAMSGFAQDIRYDFAHDANFSKYKTFNWGQTSGSKQINQLTEQELIAAIEAELATKGLTKLEDGTPDLTLVLQVAVNQEKQFSSYSTDWGYGPGWGRGYYGGGMGSTTTTGQTSTIYIGSVALDMYDTAAKQLVWRGQASKTIDQKAKPDKVRKNIDKGVTKLLKNFPPPPPKK
jgi:hypothetical protein